MKKRVLLVLRHEVLSDRLVANLEGDGFEVVACLRDEDALERLEGESFDAFVLGGGIEPSSRSRLTEAAEAAKPDIRIIEHFGSPNALAPRVRAALGTGSS
jgi:DNA-binding response OmpR family regulator